MKTKKTLYRYIFYYSLQSIIVLIVAIADIIISKRAHPIILSLIYVLVAIVFVLVMAAHTTRRARVVQMYIPYDKKDVLSVFIRKKTMRTKVRMEGASEVHYGNANFGFFLIPIIVEKKDTALCCHLPQKYAIELKKVLRDS